MFCGLLRARLHFSLPTDGLAPGSRGQGPRLGPIRPSPVARRPRPPSPAGPCSALGAQELPVPHEGLLGLLPRGRSLDGWLFVRGAGRAGSEGERVRGWGPTHDPVRPLTAELRAGSPRPQAPPGTLGRGVVSEIHAARGPPGLRHGGVIRVGQPSRSGLALGLGDSQPLDHGMAGTRAPLLLYSGSAHAGSHQLPSGLRVWP